MNYYYLITFNNGSDDQRENIYPIDYAYCEETYYSYDFFKKYCILSYVLYDKI